MAKKFNDELTGQAKEREAVNATGVARREKEKAARQANAVKQKRYRESMKAQGYKSLKARERLNPLNDFAFQKAMGESGNTEDAGED
jgi:hypothetical protein